MKNIKDVKNLKGKEVLMRVGFNVPIYQGEVLNDFRIKKTLPTVKYLQNQGAKIILIGHIGRSTEDTFKPVFEYLREGMDISFIEDPLSSDADFFIENMKEGEVVLVENLRQNEGEKNNDDRFSKQIARLGEIYVNEAFSSSHREHSSIVGIPKFLPSYSGILFEQEVNVLSKIFNPPKPAILILGGNKLKTKLPFIKKFLNIVDYIFIGGALANDFFKAKGFNVGASFVSPTELDLSDLLQNKKIILPFDVVVENSKGETYEKKPEEVLDNEKILDVGADTVSRLKTAVDESQFILFNGPLGGYERGFDGPTRELFEYIRVSEITSIIGGGDSTAMINNLGIDQGFSFVSTGGGAMLEFLINETLPGIEALKK